MVRLGCFQEGGPAVPAKPRKRSALTPCPPVPVVSDPSEQRDTFGEVGEAERGTERSGRKAAGAGSFPRRQSADLSGVCRRRVVHGI